MDFFERGPRRVNFATDSPSSVGNRRFRSTEKKERNSKPRIAQREFFRKIFRLKRCLNRRRLLLASLKQNNCETIAFSFPLHPHHYRVASAEEYSKQTTSDATFLSQTHFCSSSGNSIPLSHCVSVYPRFPYPFVINTSNHPVCIEGSLLIKPIGLHCRLRSELFVY